LSRDLFSKNSSGRALTEASFSPALITFQKLKGRNIKVFHIKKIVVFYDYLQNITVSGTDARKINT